MLVGVAAGAGLFVGGGAVGAFLGSAPQADASHAPGLFGPVLPGRSLADAGQAVREPAGGSVLAGSADERAAAVTRGAASPRPSATPSATVPPAATPVPTVTPSASSPTPEPTSTGSASPPPDTSPTASPSSGGASPSPTSAAQSRTGD